MSGLLTIKVSHEINDRQMIDRYRYIDTIHNECMIKYVYIHFAHLIAPIANYMSLRNCLSCFRDKSFMNLEKIIQTNHNFSQKYKIKKMESL